MGEREVEGWYLTPQSHLKLQYLCCHFNVLVVQYTVSNKDSLLSSAKRLQNRSSRLCDRMKANDPTRSQNSQKQKNWHYKVTTTHVHPANCAHESNWIKLKKQRGLLLTQYVVAVAKYCVDSMRAKTKCISHLRIMFRQFIPTPVCNSITCTILYHCR